MCGVLVHGRFNDRNQFLRNVRSDGQEFGRLFLLNLLQDFVHTFAGERGSSGKGFVKDRPEGIDVGPAILNWG